MKDLSQIIVVDVESTCWDKEPPSGEESEIIEIGIAVMDGASLDITASHSIMVCPQHSRVSEFCTKLTTITQADVDKGIEFEQACEWIKKNLKPKDKVWASWGNYDRNMFTDQCARNFIKYPWGKGHINICTLFSLMHGMEVEPGMAEALGQVGLALVGTHHRGEDDAKNIAGILKYLLGASRKALRR